MGKLIRRKDGRYCRQIRINGRIVSFYGKSERDINRKMLEYHQAAEKGRSFESVAGEWANKHFETVEHNTIKQYRPALKQITEHFSGKGIKDITSKDIDIFLHILADKGYAMKTVKSRLQIINQVFKYGVINNYIENNPCQYISVPKNLPQTKRELPTAEEIETVKNSINKTFGLFAYFILYTGLRRGEALALTYNDIDFKNKIIHVNKSVYYVGNIPNIKQPKTKAGYRDVILLDCLASKLKQKNTSDLIFPNHNGELIRNGNFNRLWAKYLSETGLSITPHQLRHAYATILFEAEIDVKDAQELLGHSTIQVTRDIYTHISKARKTQTADKLNKFVSLNQEKVNNREKSVSE